MEHIIALLGEEEEEEEEGEDEEKEEEKEEEEERGGGGGGTYMKIAAVDGRNNRNSSIYRPVLTHALNASRTTTTSITLLPHFNVGQRPYFGNVPTHDA